MKGKNVDKRSEFNAALKEAVKSKDTVAMSTIRLILAALKDRDIAARGQGQADGIEEKDILSMLQSMIKQRQESAATYEKAGRAELAEREQAEVGIIENFLPRQLGDEEMKAAVDKIITDQGVSDIRDMGKVMAELKAKYAGQLDMGKASGVVKENLAG